MEIKEQVGKRLLECRKAAGLTQMKTAELLGVAQPVYQRFEKGVFECNYAQLVRLAEIFDVSVDYIICRKGF